MNKKGILALIHAIDYKTCQKEIDDELNEQLEILPSRLEKQPTIMRGSTSRREEILSVKFPSVLRSNAPYVGPSLEPYEETSFSKLDLPVKKNSFY